MFAVVDCVPARPAQTTSPNSATPISAAERPRATVGTRRTARSRACSSRGCGHRTRERRRTRRRARRSPPSRTASAGSAGPRGRRCRGRARRARAASTTRRAATTTSRRAVQGWTSSLASSAPVPCSSISKMPSASALKRSAPCPPAGHVDVLVVAVDVDLGGGVGAEAQADGVAACRTSASCASPTGLAVADADRSRRAAAAARPAASRRGRSCRRCPSWCSVVVGCSAAWRRGVRPLLSSSSDPWARTNAPARITTAATRIAMRCPVFTGRQGTRRAGPWARPPALPGVLRR